MKKIGWLLGILIAFFGSSNSAHALSCNPEWGIPDAKSTPQEQATFEAQTREQFGRAELVAEGMVVNIGATVNFDWNSSQMVEVKVMRYLREPVFKQASDVYHITAAPDTLKANDVILFFAHSESESSWRERQVPPDQELDQEIVRVSGGIPKSFTQRVWFAQGACTDPVYAIDAPKNAYLVQFARRMAEDKLAPASLDIRFGLTGAPAQASAGLSLNIESPISGVPSRAVQVTPTGIKLDLPAGRYQLLWPELPGYRAACFTEYEKADCALNLAPGSSKNLYVDYKPLGSVVLIPVDKRGSPFKLLGELEWTRVDASVQPKLAERSHWATPESNFEQDISEYNDHDGTPIVPGRYQLNWVIKTYASSQKTFETCDLLDTRKLALRWRIAASSWANVHEVPTGQSVAFVEIPDSELVKLAFSHAQGSKASFDARPRCAEFWGNRISANSPLEVFAIRGQQFQLSYTCYGCEPKQWGVHKLYTAEQNLQLKVK
jgi:hypothetical protein